MALREILAKFGFDIDDKKLGDADKKTNDFKANIKELAGLYLGEQLVSGVKEFITGLEEQAAQISDTSARLGLNTQELQRWQLAAKFAGAESTHVAAGFKVLQKNAADAVAGASAPAEAFSRLGVSLKDVNGSLKPSPQLMRDTLVALSALEDESERNALAMKTLGEAGLALGPLVADGAAGLDQLLGKLDELGGGLGDDALQVLGETGDRLDELDATVLAFKSRLSVTLVPALNTGIETFTKLLSWISRVTKESNVFQAAALVLGVVVGKVAIGMYAKFIPIIALIAAVVLIVDDLITLFKGGDSVIGRAIDKLFGAGTAAKVVEDVKAAWDRFFGGLEAFPGIGAKIEAVFTRLGAAAISWLDSVAGEFGEAWDFLVKDAKAFVDDLIMGIVNGIVGSAYKVTKAFKDLGKDMFRGIKEVFQSNSPSLVMDRFMDQDVGGGAVRGLARAAVKVRDQARETFGGAIPGTPGAFSPTIQVRAAPAAAGPSTRHVDQRNNIQMTFQVNGGNLDGVRAAARGGLGDALDDDRRAMMAALEPTGG